MGRESQRRREGRSRSDALLYDRRAQASWLAPGRCTQAGLVGFGIIAGIGSFLCLIGGIRRDHGVVRVRGYATASLLLRGTVGGGTGIVTFRGASFARRRWLGLGTLFGGWRLQYGEASSVDGKERPAEFRHCVGHRQSRGRGCSVHNGGGCGSLHAVVPRKCR